MLPEYIPLELHGMSIFTAIIITVMFVGWGSYFWWDRREHTYVNNHVIEVEDKVNILFEKIDETNKDISSMKSHMAGIHEAVEWIKKYMEQRK